MNIDELVAIDIHTHAEVSSWQPPDAFGKEFDEAADRYFNTAQGFEANLSSRAAAAQRW